jgi:hypothetical protein
VSVVNVTVYGRKLAPLVSFSSAVTSNVYETPGSSASAGVRTMASPPPEVLTTAAIGAWSLVR